MSRRRRRYASQTAYEPLYSTLPIRALLRYLLQERVSGRLTPSEERENDDSLYRHIIALWQTAMLRLVKLKVTDEVRGGACV
jgi:phosphoenolpyruvate carboxylase